MKQNSPIVVTGGNGMAGSAIVKHLREQMFTCVIPITHQDVDLRNHEKTLETLCRIRPEYVVHTAATVYGLQGNMDNQGKSIFDNTLINTNVIDASHQAGVKKIVAMGTNAVYPWPPKLPYKEETIFDGRPHYGEAAYGHAKRHMLAMLEAYQTSYGMDFTYLVSGNLFGPRDKFDPVNGHVLPSLIHKFYEASRDENIPVVIWGDGSARRDFLYSADLARIVKIVMEEPQATGAINVGSGDLRSIEYIAKRLSGISGVDYDRVVYDVTKPTGRLDCYADLTVLRMLPVFPRTPFADGLEKTYQWYEASRTYQ